MTASIALLSLYDRATGEHFSHTNRMKQLFEESAQLQFPQKISVLIQLTELCAQNEGTSRVQWKTEQTHSPFKVQSVNKTGYDCHYGKVKYHAHFKCMCLLTTVELDTENKESNVIYSHHKSLELVCS